MEQSANGRRPAIGERARRMALGLVRSSFV